MFESTRRSFYGGTGALLGQDVARELQKALELTRQYCVAANHYAELAKDDPDFAGTAEWYRDLCAEANTSLSKIRRRVMRQMPGTERGMAPPPSPMRPTQGPPSIVLYRRPAAIPFRLGPMFT